MYAYASTLRRSCECAVAISKFRSPWSVVEQKLEILVLMAVYVLVVCICCMYKHNVVSVLYFFLLFFLFYILLCFFFLVTLSYSHNQLLSSEQSTHFGLPIGFFVFVLFSFFGFFYFFFFFIFLFCFQITN